jgi:hypothetical protein
MITSKSNKILQAGWQRDIQREPVSIIVQAAVAAMGWGFGSSAGI